MNYTLVDIAGLSLATLAAITTVCLPGAALAEACDLLGFRTRPAQQRWGLAVLSGLALLPLLESTLTRYFGLGPALLATLLLALRGAFVLARGALSALPGWPTLLALAGWFLLVAFMTVDFDTGAALYQSYTVIDMVKHAATVSAIVESGAPPADAFYARAEPSGYYYFFYTLGAIIQKVVPVRIDARATIGALMVVVGPALHAMVLLLLERAGLLAQPARRALSGLVALLLLASGLDLVPITLLGVSSGSWVPQLDMWNEAVVSWTDALFWVPHHVTAVLAAWVGFLTLTEEISAREQGARREWLRVLAASLAFVSSVGMSVWTTLVAGLAALLWGGVLLYERRYRALRVLVVAGLAAAVIGLPHLLDMAQRSDDGFPLALTIRGFDQWDVRVGDTWLRYLGRVLLLPLNYFLELGVFALGAWLFYKQHRRAEVHRNEVARLLFLYAAAGFLFATFTRSTVLMNDIAWRAPLAFQLAMVVWTAAALHQLRLAPETLRLWSRRGLVLVAALGWSATLYGVVAQRAYPMLRIVPWASYVNARPETSRALRAAYEQLADELAPSRVVQHNPAPPRVFDFGLYGRHRVGVADRQASLYGAAKRDVNARVDLLEPIFTRTLAAAEVRARAVSAGVDQLIVTVDDAPWQDRASWVWAREPLYQNERVRVISTEQLAPADGLQANCICERGCRCRD